MNLKLSNIKYVFVSLLFSFLLCDCNAFRYNTSFSKAENKYLLITENKENFGDKRLFYNKYYFRCTLKENFFCPDNNRKNPDFIHEYSVEKNRNGLEMFYMSIDSVYVFEEVEKWSANSKLKEIRKINETEKKSIKRF